MNCPACQATPDKLRLTPVTCLVYAGSRKPLNREPALLVNEVKISRPDTPTNPEEGMIPETNLDFEGLRAEILALHEASIQAHWDKDVDYFTRDVVEGYFSVSNGDIHRRALVEIEAQFTGYLNNTIFTEYEDLREPLVGFSRDGSLAWLLAQTKIAGRRKMDDGTIREMDFTCAYIMLFERRGERWVRLGDVSTFR